VTDKGQKYCVFLYPSGAADSAEAFATTRQFIESDGSSRAVYYARSHSATPHLAIPMDPSERDTLLSLNAVPAGEYAMWWRRPRFGFRNIPHLFSCSTPLSRLRCIETFVLADVLQALGKGRGPRTALPTTAIG
jgi:hypothetical protein